MSRNLLHISKLDQFKEWLDEQGIQHRAGRGDWQVLQVCKDGKHWNCVYERIDMPEHFTVDVRLESLVRRFINDSRAYTIQVPRAEYEALRKISERWDLIETLMFIGDVELRQDEDGGYSVSVEPVENILAQRWTGNSPEEVIDAAIAAINMPANGEGAGRG